jgi:hypothetical protein
MKTTFKLCLLILLYWIQPLHLTAQQYSEWSVDPVRKSLKARYMKFKATDGYNWIRLQVVSTKDCTMEITSTLCMQIQKTGMDGNVYS